MAGQMIMQGFVNFHIPIWVRRLVTMVPAFFVIGIGVNATEALIVSQVILSIALPVPMIALVLFTARSDIMGEFKNRRLTNIAATLGATIVLTLNVVLILLTFGVSIPGLPAG
jgi:manganese transport protein